LAFSSALLDTTSPLPLLSFVTPTLREQILDKKLTVERVAARIQEEYEDFLHIMHSDENAQVHVLRIRQEKQQYAIAPKWNCQSNFT
jgi:hypothetical protein